MQHMMCRDIAAGCPELTGFTRLQAERETLQKQQQQQQQQQQRGSGVVDAGVAAAAQDPQRQGVVDPQNARQREQAQLDLQAAADQRLQQSQSPGQQQQGSVAGQDATGAADSQAQQRQQEGEAQGAQVMFRDRARACSSCRLAALMSDQPVKIQRYGGHAHLSDTVVEASVDIARTQQTS